MKKPAPTHEPHPGFVKASQHAREELVRLRAIKEKDAYMRGKVRAEVKTAALRLLSQCGTPPPLTMLIGELFKLPRQKRPPREAALLSQAQLVAADIEAKAPPDPKGKRPSSLNHRALWTALVREMEEIDEIEEAAPHRTTVRKWDKERAYWEAVYSRRPGGDSLEGCEAFKHRKV